MALVELCVFPRTSDLSDIITGSLAVSTGWGMTLAYRQLRADTPEERARFVIGVRHGKGAHKVIAGSG